MVRDNLWTPAGVVNGAVGVVQDVVLDPASRPGARRAVALVELPGYKGPPLIASQPKVVPIRMSKSDWLHGRES